MRGEGTPFARMAGRIVCFQHSNRIAFGSGGGLFFFWGKTVMRCKFADIRQVLLEFILSKAVHYSPPNQNLRPLNRLLQA